jgi:hypothetical protein
MASAAFISTGRSSRPNLSEFCPHFFSIAVDLVERDSDSQAASDFILPDRGFHAVSPHLLDLAIEI